MARTTAAVVKLVLGDSSTHPEGAGDYDGVRDLAPFIDSATAIVDRVEACAAAKGKALTSAELELIERWLTAHLYAMSDQQYQSKSTQAASASFRAVGGLNLDGSTYGQTAKLLDYSGCLAAIANRQTAGLTWLGKPPSDQIAYEDRD